MSRVILVKEKAEIAQANLIFRSIGGNLYTSEGHLTKNEQKINKSAIQKAPRHEKESWK